MQALSVAPGVEVGPLFDGFTIPTQEKSGRAGRPREMVNKQPKKKGG
jgi:hypothetical protein